MVGKEYIMRKERFRTEPLPGDFRLRYLPLLIGGMYLSFNAVTGAMIMAGAKMQADPFFHAPLYWLPQLKSFFGL